MDFEQFPRMLESLLKGCNTGHYQCRLTESGPSCTLQIVEPSTFKELTHLRLTIVKNTDREIRPYLSNRVNELTNGVRALRSHAGKALGQRDLAMAEVARLKSEVGRLELEKEVSNEKEEEVTETLPSLTLALTLVALCRPSPGPSAWRCPRSSRRTWRRLRGGSRRWRGRGSRARGRSTGWR